MPNSYASFRQKGDELFKLEDMMWHIEERIAERQDQPKDETERNLMICSEFEQIKNEYAMDKTKEVFAKMASEFIEMCNPSNGIMVDVLFEELMKSHRTIQSEFFSLLLNLMKKISTADERLFDPRNEHTKQLSTKILEAIQ